MTQQHEPTLAQGGAFAWNALFTGLAATVVATALWVALTAFSDGETTYHLFPLVIGAAAPLVSRYVVTDPLRAIEALAAAALGLIGVAVGWIVLIAVDTWPSATFIDDQPGGVEGETIALALLGALLGLVYASNWRP